MESKKFHLFSVEFLQNSRKTSEHDNFVSISIFSLCADAMKNKNIYKMENYMSKEQISK